MRSERNSVLLALLSLQHRESPLIWISMAGTSAAGNPRKSLLSREFFPRLMRNPSSRQHFLHVCEKGFLHGGFSVRTAAFTSRRCSN